MKVFTIENPNAGYDDVVKIAVCAESIDYIIDNLKYDPDDNFTTLKGFERPGEISGLVFEYVKPDDLIVTEVELDHPKVICVDIWEG